MMRPEYLLVKHRTYEILSGIKSRDWISVLINYIIITLIVLSVISVMIESVESLHNRYKSALRSFEILSIIVFSVEYILRLWSCTSDTDYRDRITGRLRFAFSFFAIVDLVAILPFYIPFLIAVDLRFVRILRILRIFRLVKLVRYTNAFSQMIRVFRERREHLVITLSSILVLIVFVSGIMFIIEHDAQPEKFSSIPETMWWAVCTMTTVGYGDVYPITVVGKLLAGIVSVLGLCLFAVPAGIISSGFISQSTRRQDTVKGGSEK